MTVSAAIWWTIGAAWLLVFIMIVLQLVRVARQLGRATRRVGDYADLPVVAAVDRGEANIARLEGAAGQIDPLLVRARAAAEVIKRGPFPPEIVGAYVRVRSELAAFRAAVPPRR
ncbi:MAG TPA: hypothetical protein VFE70_05525 [Candidatus Elarobacter sp.]|nr:hypothetical protein [Candidatus Elarobacter sp.]